MSQAVIALQAAEATLERVGGKGANLSEIARAGFAVPPGFLISTDAYRAFVRENQISDHILAIVRRVAADDPVALEQVSAQIRGLFEKAHIPETLSRQISTAYSQLSAAADLPVAVRSSATAEDLPGMSFAGQQDSYLNIVGAQALLDAVKRCWASLWTARAIGYRARNGIAPDHVALAVVVQQLVPSEVSGILFTANPLTGRRAEMVIDASFGLGEAIVSGQVEPDHYVVDSQSRRIRSRKLGAKALAIVPQTGGGTYVEIQGKNDAAQQSFADQQALSDAQILELAGIAQRIAEHFGEPQDIEWAFADGKLAILQSRPITSLYPLPAVTHRTMANSSGSYIYWSFGSVQGVLDPLTPFGRDVLRTILAPGFFRFLQLDTQATDIVLEAGERLYIDISGATALWRVIFPNIDPGAGQTLEKLIADGLVPVNKPFSPAERRRLLPKLGMFLIGALRSLHAPEFQRARVNAKAAALLEEARRSISKARNLNDILDHMADLTPRFISEVLPRALPIVTPGVGAMKLIDRWLVEWLTMPPGAVFQLLRGLPGNVTSEMDLNLWATVQSIRANPPACETMLSQPLETLVQDYVNRKLPTVAQESIERFVAQYGMRAVGEIDFGRKRWREDLTPLLQTMRNYLQQDEPSLAPDVTFARGAAESQRLAQEWVALLRQKPFGRPRAAILSFAIDRMRRMIGFRESPKFFIIQLFGIYRAALLEQARQMVQKGALEQPEDLFFLHIDELDHYARGEPIDLRALVAEARAANQHEQGRRRIPRLMLSTGESFYEGMAVENDGDLRGDPVSPGIVEGKAHVVLDPHGVRLEPGEILVCPATDPGWTPLFLTAGGLVMEIGGMITHGSVVAREYGIPAVVGVHEATTRIQSGQRLRVDGGSGRVSILQE